jgi:hypothetical protein
VQQADCAHKGLTRGDALLPLRALPPRSSGVLKGLILAPLVLPALIVGILAINCAALPLWLDHAFATLY